MGSHGFNWTMAKRNLSTARSSGRFSGRSAVAVATLTDAAQRLLALARERGSYRMDLLEHVKRYTEDRAWLEAHIAGQKLTRARQLEAGWDAAIDQDGAIGAFESRWRVRVDLDLGRVDVATGSPPVATKGTTARSRSRQALKAAAVDRQILSVVASGPRSPGPFARYDPKFGATPALPDPVPDLRSALYIYDDSIAISVKPLTSDTSRHLARHARDPDREFVLDRLGTRREAEPLLRALQRKGKQRAPEFPMGVLSNDSIIVAKCANGTRPDIVGAVAVLFPKLARDVFYVDGARRPPTKPPTSIRTPDDHLMWKNANERWKRQRKQVADRWKTLTSWVSPTEDTLPMREWTPNRSAKHSSLDGILRYVGEGIEPQVVPSTSERYLMPGESYAYPRRAHRVRGSNSRRNVRTIRRH